VYRSAWTPERAFELLRAESGSAFDERCVEALSRVVDAAPAWVAGVADAMDAPARARRPSSRPAQA
jgi:HD-GYP domain-containing protein (c-di-GMP phosphodiesterase class II)